MRVLITGASGFIGSEIVKQLLSREHQILALSRTPEAGTCKVGVHWVKSDLADPFSYQSEVESFQPDVLIHLGWQDIPDFSFEKSWPANFFEKNVGEKILAGKKVAGKMLGNLQQLFLESHQIFLAF